MFLFHYIIFGQLENTIYYSLMSLCFIPINILGVTLVFEKLEDRRAKIERLNKLNMLVGLFFSDVGFNLLKLIAAGDTKINLLNLDFNDIRACANKFTTHDHDISFELIDYPKLKQLVIGSREILSTLIANENILEHETFTDLLMALMHLRDEILFIQHKEELNHDDCIHLKGDLVRVYKTLTVQWINYLSHLKQFYPFQYNSAIKFNPFTINI
jgi:hypothetical protein